MTVWINKDFSSWNFPQIDITFAHLLTGKKLKGIVSSDRPYTEFLDLEDGDDYLVEIGFRNIFDVSSINQTLKRYA